MPEFAIYRHEWTEKKGIGRRLDFLPRAALGESLDGAPIIPIGKAGIIEGSLKISAAQFPAEKPIGFTQVPTLEVGYELLSLPADMTTYLMDPVSVGGGSVELTDNPASDVVSFDTANVVVLWTDNGTRGAEWECIFVGAQRILPGEDGEVRNPGQPNAAIPTTFRFAHIALFVLETIQTDWIARRAIGEETPDGGNAASDGYTVACNLLYFHDGRIYVLAEWVDGQKFWLYTIAQLFNSHLRTLFEAVYGTLLRDAYGAVTASFYSIGHAPSPYYGIGDGPYGTISFRQAQHSETYGVITRTTALKFKGVIRQGSEIVGGYYSPLSADSIYQWKNAWDFLKKQCDGAACKGVIVQTDVATIELHFIPSEENVRPGGVNQDTTTLTRSDVEANVKYRRNGGLVKGANVQAGGSGSLDITEHTATAKGIRAEEDLPLDVAFHNMVPLWDVVRGHLTGLLQTGVFNDENGTGDYIVKAAYIETYTCDTIYLTYAAQAPTGEHLTSEAAGGGRLLVPVLTSPATAIYRGIEPTSLYNSGYDLDAFTPLPTPTGSPEEFAKDIKAAAIAAQRSACLPHVLAEFLVADFGAGNVAKPVIWEFSVSEELARIRHLGDTYELEGGNGNLFLPDGSTFFSNLSGEPQLVKMEPEFGRCMTKVVLLGRD